MSGSGSDGWDFGSGGGYQPSLGPADRLGLTKIGPYEIEGEIARGGMGVVYRGRDLRLGRPVAIKLLLAPQTQDLEAQRIRRFTREAEALASLSHPGLLSVYDFGLLPHPKVPYMVTEWLEGETLEERLRHTGTLPVAESLDLAEAIARAVGYAHEQGILHRDLKPSNVVLAPRGPVVIDFGLAKRQDPNQSRLTQTGAMAGTTGFAAPEQLRDAARVDERADVYGLGATLYSLLTGFPPGGHEGRNILLLAANATGKFPLPSELREEVPRQVDQLLAQALALDPDARMPDANAFAEALANLGPLSRGSAWPRVLGGVAAIAALIALGVVVGQGILALRESQPSPIATPGPSPSASFAPSPTPATGQSPSLASADDPTAHLSQKLERVEAELREVAIEPAALRPLYARGEALAEQILAATEVSSLRWPAIRFLVAAGRVERSQALLRELARDPEFVARANLDLAWLALTRPGGEGLQPALRRAAARSSEGPTDDEGLARRLAGILLRAQAIGSNRSAASSIQIELARILDEVGGLWSKRSVWATCVFAASFAPPKFRQLISQAWTAPRPSRPELQLPGYLTICAWHLSLASAHDPNAIQELSPILEAHAERIDSLDFQLALAHGQASGGSRGGLERTLARRPGIPKSRKERLLRQVDLMAESRGGTVVGELQAAPLEDADRSRLEWLRVRCDPTQTKLGVWLRLPPETQRWGVRLAGAEVDFDLRLRRDGPPNNASGWTRAALTMARNERLESRGGGLYFLQLERSTPWAIPLELTLELHTSPTLRLSRDPWEFPMPNTVTKGIREAFAASREHFAAGQIDDALSALDPHLERAPQATFVRWSLLDFAARWETLNSDVRKAAEDASPRGYLAAWLKSRCLAATGQLPAAEATLSQLTREAPDLLEAWTTLVSVRAGLGRLSQAQAALGEARRRFPDAPVLELLELALAGPERHDAFAIRFRQLQGHAFARRQALSLLFFLGRGADALPLLDALPPELRDHPRQVIFRAYANASLDRLDEARALLESVKPVDLSPQLKAQFARARRALSVR